MAGRGGRAPAEMERPVAVAQHLHGGRLGQEARRDLQARLAARPEDHLLPALDGRDARREVDQQGRRAQRRVELGRAVLERCGYHRGRRGRRPQVLLDRQSRVRGMSVISLGSRTFTGPFLAPVWTPPRAAGLYAVMMPGWRLLTFHPVHIGHAADLAYAGLLRGHDHYAEWLSLAA